MPVHMGISWDRERKGKEKDRDEMREEKKTEKEGKSKKEREGGREERRRGGTQGGDLIYFPKIAQLQLYLSDNKSWFVHRK